MRREDDYSVKMNRRIGGQVWCQPPR